MTTLKSTIETIIGSFPIAIIAPIVGTPRYETLQELSKQLGTNAASVASELGGGKLGHLTLTVPAAEYLVLSGSVAFNAPANPGPIYVTNVQTPTANQLSLDIRTHGEELRFYKLYKNTDLALKNQIIGAVEPIYLRTLKAPNTGYVLVTTLSMLTYLHTTYGTIQPHHIEDNEKRFKLPYDPSQPFESFITQIEDAVAFAFAGGDPCPNTRVVNNAYNLVYQTGVFPEACRTWRDALDT